MKSCLAIALQSGLALGLAACGARAPLPPIEILPTPAAVQSFTELSGSVLEVQHGDELAYVQGYIWTKTEKGFVFKIDPATNTVVGQLKVDVTPDIEHYCQGLGGDGEHVWACSARGGFDDEKHIDVVAVDPATLQILATVPVDKVFDQFVLPHLDHRIWVLTGNGSTLVGIDTTTFEPGPALDLGARCTNLATAGAVLVAACTVDNQVLRIDPTASPAITARTTITEPYMLGGNAQGVWVLRESELVRLDPVTLAPAARLTHLPSLGREGGIYVTDDAVWIRRPGDFLFQIDPATNQIDLQITGPGQPFGGSVLITEDWLWTTDYELGQVYRLPRP